MADTPAAAPPAAPPSTSPSITFGGGSPPAAPAVPATPAPETGHEAAAPEAPSKFEFQFEGDEEKYSFEEKPEEGAAPAESYDASKPFSPEAEAALKDHPELLKLFKQQHYEMRQW